MGGIVGPKWPTPLAKRIRLSDTPLPTFISSSLPFKSLKYASFCEKLPFLKENGHFQGFFSKKKNFFRQIIFFHVKRTNFCYKLFLKFPTLKKIGFWPLKNNNNYTYLSGQSVYSWFPCRFFLRFQWQESQTTRAQELIPDLFPCTRWMEGIGLLTHGCLHAVAMLCGHVWGVKHCSFPFISLLGCFKSQFWLSV